MRAKWTQIENAKLDVVELLKMLADGKSIEEIQKNEPDISDEVIKELFIRLEIFVRMHLLLDELFYLQRKTLTEQNKLYRNGCSNITSDEENEIRQLRENQFSIEKIAKMFRRDKEQIQEIIEKIKRKGVKDG